MKKKFRIEYLDPEDQECKEVLGEFEDTTDPDITAKEWAEDYAYGLADKGWYCVTEQRG